jgi:hypothetical protein
VAGSENTLDNKDAKKTRNIGYSLLVGGCHRRCVLIGMMSFAVPIDAGCLFSQGHATHESEGVDDR